jgi:hypothetical protein
LLAAQYETCTDFLSADGPDESSADRNHQRLGVCLATSALVMFVGIATLDVSLHFDFSRWIPLVLEVNLREAIEPVADVAPEAQPEPQNERAPKTALTAPTAETVQPDVPAATTPPAAASPAAAGVPTDWYGSIERVSADVISRQAAPASLHPEFDELRRIAAIRYAEPQTGIPRPIWENVEKDIYGRTLLKKGNCFRVLDDSNVGNRYAFETFEQYLTFCTWSGKRPPRNLPWVETIRARYPYLREPAEDSLPPIE